MGRFDNYYVLVGQAFHELIKKLDLIPSRTDTTVALYEPKRGVEHTEGFFYVGCIVTEEPKDVPQGSEYIYLKGRYACASGTINQMGQIYDNIIKWIEENGLKQIWPNTLFVERYEFKRQENGITGDEIVEVMLPVEESN